MNPLPPTPRGTISQLAPQARSAIGARLAFSFGGLRAEFGANAPRFGVAQLLAIFVINFLGRVFARLDRLALLWETGRLPSPRPSRARVRQPNAEPATSPAEPRLRMPTGHAWLARAGYHFRGYANQIQHLLHNDPELAAFLAAAPQAGRILRPLCRALGIAAPVSIQRAAEPRAPRPRKPAPRPEPTPKRDHYAFSQVPPKWRLKVPGLKKRQR